MQVHIINGGNDYAGSYALVVFADEADAKSLLTKLNEHVAAEPAYDQTEQSIKLIDEWRMKHPLKKTADGLDICYDFYFLKSLDVIEKTP